MGKLSATLTSLLALSGSVLAQKLCNGHAEYCDKKYSSMSFAAAHNSPFVGESPTQNQHLEVTEQLDMGIRFLQGSTQSNFLHEVRWCHTDCFLEDAGPLDEYLGFIKGWLDGHKDEVVSLIIGNGDGDDPKKFDKAFESSGLKDYAFIPSGSPDVLKLEDWPTMGELIESGKRMIVFMDNNANVEEVPYILDQFSYWFETPFSPVKFDSCAVDRPANSGPDGKMYVLNHNLNLELAGSDILIPDILRISKTNAATGAGSIGEHVDMCKGLYADRAPNAIILDYVDKGEVMAVERGLNGV